MHGPAKILEEIGVLLELKGENPFKSRAYYSAARTVDALGAEELERLARAGELKNLKGIGAALAEKISELVITGSLPYYDQLKESVPPGLLDLLKVPGLGPRKVSELSRELEISTLAELEYACRENRLVKLKGFGLKTQQNILDGIEFLRRHQGRFFYHEALTAANQLKLSLQGSGLVEEVEIAGSVRRCLETAKDVDLVAASSSPVAAIDHLCSLEAVEEVISRGSTMASVRLASGISADMRVVSRGEYPFALHHFTGSKEHNTALRGRAKKLGLKVNEYGIYRGEERIECEDERDLFAALGLDFIPPELRENYGEIEAAAEGSLPELIEEADIRGIFHVHTTYSDGKDSLKSIVAAAVSAGYEYIGISDHSQSAFYAGGLKEDDLKRQGEEIAALRESYPQILILSGVESDIRADGSLDYPDQVLETLDFVIASIHSGLKMEEEKMTARVVSAISHPKVTMLGHPTNRLLLGRDSSHLNLDRVFSAALDNNVIMELNANPARLDLDWRHLKKVRQTGLKVAINPDAHEIAGLNDLRYGVAIARKGWLEKEDVVNTMSRQELESSIYFA